MLISSSKKRKKTKRVEVRARCCFSIYQNLNKTAHWQRHLADIPESQVIIEFMPHCITFIYFENNSVNFMSKFSFNLRWCILPSTCISTLVLYVPEISATSFISRKGYFQHWYGTVRSKLLLLLVHSTRNYSPHHLNQHHILHSLRHILHSFDISQYQMHSGGSDPGS